MQAYDIGSDPEPADDADLSRLYPHVEASARVEVITRPKVKVFPLATTLVVVRHYFVKRLSLDSNCFITFPLG